MPGRLLGGMFEIYKGNREGEFSFRLKTRGGSVLMESVESYRSKSAAERAIQLAAGVAGGAKIVDLTEDGAGSV
jgi:uncharacterized protein YegP (UPF0339 family)